MTEPSVGQPHPTGSRSGRSGEATRVRILDACEVLFAEQGYVGTSVRDIAAQAQVRLGSVHYHFGAKDRILAATIDRKLGLLKATIQASFDQIRAEKAELGIADAVRAFIMPFLKISVDRTSELRDFVIMTSHLMSSYRIPEIKPSLMRLSAISDIFTGSVREIVPAADESDLLTAAYLIEAALIFMVQDPGLPRRSQRPPSLRRSAR